MIFSIRYTIIRLMRNRSNIFWILCFPIILGTFFKMAFSNLDTADTFNPIPVAVVGAGETDNTDTGIPSLGALAPSATGGMDAPTLDLKELAAGINAQTFRKVLDSMAEKGDNQMLEITYCGEKQAEKLLKKKKIDGILTLKEQVHLTISADMKGRQMNQSILNSFVDQYNINQSILAYTATNNPSRFADLISKMTDDTAYRKEVSYAYHDSGVSTQYFYNLIAMACLYTAIGGVVVASENQGNLSINAARKNVSATPKGTTIAGELIASILFEFVLNLLGYLFIVFILRIDMGFRMGLAILAILVSTMTGITFGFFLGSLGDKSQEFKTGMVFATTMPCCFLSGLMVGDMRMIVARYIPWFNHINPAALISDSFYSLTAYESLNRYFANILTLCAFTVIFTAVGIIMTRRNRYASI